MLSISELGKPRGVTAAGVGWRRGESAPPREGILPSANKPQPFPPSPPPHAPFVGHLGESVDDADQVIHKEGCSTTASGQDSWYVPPPRTSSATAPHPFPPCAPHCLLASRSQLSNSSTLCIISLGSKRSLASQADIPEPKRRRTALKRSHPATSGTEAGPGPSAPVDDESELVALRRTLQQVQQDLSALQQDQSALQQDQRQLDDITRGIQHDLDEAQPRDTLRFLEEHFTCAL